jgi:hypothetical protein
MSATVLEIGRDVYTRLGLGIPSALVNSADETAAQMVQMIQQAGRFCYDEDAWEIGISMIELTTLAQEEQGELSTLIPDLDYLTIDRAFYETDMTAEVEVQVRGGKLYITPAPDAGDTLVIYYQRRAWLLRGVDLEPVDMITSDSDIILLDRELMILATKAAWKLEKGLPADADVAGRNKLLWQKRARDGLRKTLIMDEEPRRLTL